MRSMLLPVPVLALFVFALVGGTACGGGGSGAPLAPMASVAGMVVKDPVAGCDLRVCEVDPATGAVGAATLGAARSAGGGTFAFDFLAAQGGIYALSGSGGAFANRATGMQDSLGAFDLRGIFCVESGGRADANLTVMSTMVAFRFQHLRSIRPYMPAKLLLRLAKAEMSYAFGITNVDACPDPAGTADQVKLWLLDVGLVQMAMDLGVPAAELIRLFSEDLMDGRPDGLVCGETTAFASGSPWRPDSLTLLRTAIGLWLAFNPLNDTGIGTGDPIYLALVGSLDVFVLRAALGTLPRILSFTKRFVPESGGSDVGAYIAPYPAPGNIDIETLDFDGDVLAVHVPTGTTTDADGVHWLPFVTPPAAKGLHYVLARDRTTGLFDAEPLHMCTPGLTQLQDVRPKRIIVTGGSLVKVIGSGFDAANPPNVKIGGKVAAVEQVLSPYCVRVWAPEGERGAIADLDVDGMVIPGAFVYSGRRLPTGLDGDDFRRFSARFSTGDGAGGSEICVLEGTLNLTERSYDLRRHRADDVTALGERLQGFLDLIINETGPESELPLVPVGKRVLLDIGIELEVEPTVGPSDDDFLELIVAHAKPDHPAVPPSGIGTGLLLGTGTSKPKILRTYDVTGTCIERGLRTVVRGQATFRADGRVFLSGGVSSRNAAGRAFFYPLGAVGGYTLDESGTLDLSNLSAGLGFTLARGIMSPGGSTGSVVLKGPGKLVHLLLSARPTELDMPADAFGPDVASAGARLGTPVSEVRFARTSLQIRDGQCVMLGGLHRLEHEESTGDLRHEELVRAVPGYVSFHGRTSSASGLSTGVLGEKTALTWDGLPQDGLDSLGDLAGSGLGYGLATSGDMLVSVRSWRSDYKVLAMGIELEPDATPTPNPEHRSVMELGCLVRETSEVDVAGITFAMAAKMRWDRLKRKEVDRDAAGVVTTTISGSSSASGYAMVVAGGEFYAFACPLPPGGTKCFFRGCLTSDGSFGMARSSDGFGAPWHAILLRKPRSAPPVDGTYNTKFFCHTFDGAGTAYAINGAGTYAFDAGLGTHVQDTSQVATSETLATIPSGPDTYPGTFTVDADGCILMTTDFGGGFTSDLCGAVHENGSFIVTMDPEPAAINCLTVYTLRDESVGAPALTPERAKLCGLHLAFDGAGGITAATRAGKQIMRPGLLDRSLRTATWSNVTTGVAIATEILSGRPLTVMPGRTFTADLALGRSLSGARSSATPVLGSQSESGVAAPAGSMSVTLRRGK